MQVGALSVLQLQLVRRDHLTANAPLAAAMSVRPSAHIVGLDKAEEKVGRKTDRRQVDGDDDDTCWLYS